MKQSILLQEHAAAGARMLEGPSPTLLTYGDVPGEYAAAQEGCAMFDETDRGLIRVGGGDRADFLHRILSNRVRELAAGQGNRNLLLSGKGKVQHDFDLLVDEGEIRLCTHPGDTAATMTAIDMYLFAEDVSLESGEEECAPLALCGPAAEGIVRELFGDAPAGRDHRWLRGSFGGRPVEIVSLEVVGSAGYRCDGGPELAAPIWRALREAGALPAGLVVRDILRCEAGSASFGVDIDDTVYPQEARLESAFNLEKGCYIGQEVVAKIDTYGGLNKRLMALRVSNDDPVPRGTRLIGEVDGERRDLGLVTSWAYSFALDSGLCLAYVKRKHQEPGTSFQLGEGGPTGEIVELPVRAGTARFGD